MFVELVRTNGNSIFLNVNQIASIVPRNDGVSAVRYGVGGESVTVFVSATPEEIIPAKLLTKSHHFEC